MIRLGPGIWSEKRVSPVEVLACLARLFLSWRKRLPRPTLGLEPREPLRAQEYTRDDVLTWPWNQ